MKIDLKRIAIRDIAEGYEDNGELGGVVGYGGNLDIRPKYQREFIYKDNQRDAVIRTVMSGFPLNFCIGRLTMTANTKCWTGNSGRYPFANLCRATSLLTTAVRPTSFTISPQKCRKNSTTTNCIFTFAKVAMAKNWIGFALLMSREKG